MDDIYELYAIRYGHFDRNAAANFIGGDPHDGPMPLDYFVWAIVGKERTFVFDTGFDAKVAEKRQRQLLRPVAEGLKMIGVERTRSKTSSSPTCISIIAAITTYSRMPATTSRTSRWRTAPGAACATNICATRSPMKTSPA